MFDTTQLRLLPSVDELLHTPAGQQLIARFSHALTVQAIRASLAQARTDIRTGERCASHTELLAAAESLLQSEQLPHFLPVINAPDAIFNTNLCRAPLSWEPLRAEKQGR